MTQDKQHRWSGWPGAWCLDCGCDDPREASLADGNWIEDADGNPIVTIDYASMICTEAGSKRHDPYEARPDGEQGRE